MSEQYFAWQGTLIDGGRCSGTMLAPDESVARLRLVARGLRALRVSRCRRFPLEEGQLTHLLHVLSVLIAAGIPLLEALALAKTARIRRVERALIDALLLDVAEGHPLSVALSRRPLRLSGVVLPVLEAAERAGTLERGLARLAAWRERDARQRAAVRAALFYPAWVLAVAMVVCLFMLLLVIPSFAVLFAGREMVPGWPARCLFALAEHPVRLLWVPGLIAAGGLATRFGREAEARRQRWCMALPVVGPLWLLHGLARWLHVLAMLLGAGVPLLDALGISGRASGVPVVAQASLRLQQVVRHGRPFVPVLAEYDWVPSMVCGMLSAGAASGHLQSMLEAAAGWCDALAQRRAEWCLRCLEPVMLLLLGGVTGFVLMALYLPLLETGQILG